MKNTKLQAQLKSYYENSKTSLRENSKYLKKITEIAGNRGLSHQERINRIKGWTDYLKDVLNDSEKEYIDQVLRINKNYVKATSRIREIKNAYGVRGDIASLRRGIRTNNLERNLESDKVTLPAETIKLDDYRQSSQGNNQKVSYLKRAGKAIVKGLVGLGVAAAITASGLIGNYLGKESQQSKIKEQEAIIKTYKQRDENYRVTLGIKDKEIETQKEAIALAGRPDEEVREETIKNTTQELTSKYEKIIESVKQQAQEQVDKLLEQQKGLEQKLIVAGRPNEADEEVIKETKQNPIEVKEFDGLKKEYEVLKEENERLKEETKVAEVVDSKFIEDSQNTQTEESTSYVLESSSIASPTVSVSREDTMAMLEASDSVGVASKDGNDCNECDEIYEEMNFQPQQYLIDKFMEYPNRTGKNHVNKNWKKKKPLEFALSLAGQGLAAANDVVEFGVARPVSGAIGGVWGAGSRALGNKDDGFKNGWKNGENFAAYAMDGVFGGISKNTFDSYLLQGKIGKAIKVPYCMEGMKDNGHAKFEGHVKLGEIIVVDTLPWVWNSLFGGHHGHRPSGGFERDGGQVDGELGRVGGTVE